MTKTIMPSEWQAHENIILEENAEKAVRIDKNAIVVAGPGAGKTELLAQKAGYLFETNLCPFPQKILAISFKKDAAANLKSRITARYGQENATRFISLTYDAFAKKTLDQFRNSLPYEFRPDKNYQIGDSAVIEAAFNKCGFKNEENLRAEKLISYLDSELSKTQLTLSRKTRNLNVWRLLLKGFDNHSACLTFKMISKLSNFIFATNPFILNGLRLTYSHVFLDEFQDTTDLQYEMVKTCFKNTNILITAVGDNKQRIMVWAGARKTIFKDFQIDFNAEKIPLVMNHRSAPRLIELQKLMFKSLKEENLELHSSSKWQVEDGEVKLFISKNDTLEANYLVDDIIEKIKCGLELNDICILVKQLPKNYMSEIISKLFDHGIKARIEIDFQELLKEPIVMLILNILSLGVKRRSPDEWEFVNNIWIEIHSFENMKKNNYYNQKHVELISILDEVKGKLLSIFDKEKLKTTVFDIVNKFGREELKAVFPQYSQGNFMDILLNKMSDLLWSEYEETLNWYQTIENFKGKNSIPIMTIHKSKGLEYSAVYFVGLEDGAFWNFRNQPEEDRCAFFVALSRAKKYLSFSFCSYRENLRYKHQNRSQINEFFELLQKPGIATIVKCD